MPCQFGRAQSVRRLAIVALYEDAHKAEMFHDTLYIRGGNCGASGDGFQSRPGIPSHEATHQHLRNGQSRLELIIATLKPLLIPAVPFNDFPGRPISQRV